MDDTISRQAAIDVLDAYQVMVENGEENPYAWARLRMRELPFAQPEPQWIPCNERLPEAEKKRYWVCTDTEYQCECRWTNNPPFFYLEMGEFDEWGWSIFDIPQHSHVVAWMPLPEPYKEEDDAVD